MGSEHPTALTSAKTRGEPGRSRVLTAFPAPQEELGPGPPALGVSLSEPAEIFPPGSREPSWQAAEQHTEPFKDFSCSVPWLLESPEEGLLSRPLHFLDRNCHFSNTASLLLARSLSPPSSLTSGRLCDALCGVLCSGSFSARLNAWPCRGPGSQRGAAGAARPPRAATVPAESVPPSERGWVAQISAASFLLCLADEKDSLLGGFLMLSGLSRPSAREFCRAWRRDVVVSCVCQGLGSELGALGSAAGAAPAACCPVRTEGGLPAPLRSGNQAKQPSHDFWRAQQALVWVFSWSSSCETNRAGAEAVTQLGRNITRQETIAASPRNSNDPQKAHSLLPA